MVGSSFRSRSPAATPRSRQPSDDTTQSPSPNPSCLDARTRPTAAPSTVSPSSYGPTYVRMPLIRPRMYGSTETSTLRTATSPASGSRSTASRSSKSLSRGSPSGRATRTTSRLTLGGYGGVGNEPVALEQLSRLVEREVGRRDDRVRRRQVLVREPSSTRPHGVGQGGEACVQRRLVAGVDRLRDVVVELVQARTKVLVDAPLALAENPDDHVAFSF